MVGVFINITKSIKFLGGLSPFQQRNATNHLLERELCLAEALVLALLLLLALLMVVLRPKPQGPSKRCSGMSAWALLLRVSWGTMIWGISGSRGMARPCSSASCCSWRA